MSYRLLTRLALIVGAFVLAGCATSPIPLAENFQLTSQKKVRSAGHWNLLSRDVVEQTLMSLEKTGATAETTLYVALPEKPTAFDLSFRDFLITELVQRGRRVMTTNNATLSLSYETRVVRHNSRRPNFTPGGFTTLTAGLFVLRELALSSSVTDAVVGSLALAGGIDLAASKDAGGPTSTELILSATVTGAGRIMTRKTDVYYVEESDRSLFSQLPGAFGGTEMRVVSQ